MIVYVANHPGLVIHDLARGPLRHVVWADSATGEYEQHIANRDGTLAIDTQTGDWRAERRKGRLLFDWRDVVGLVPEGA